MVPTIPQLVDLRGLRLFLDTLDQIKSELNPALSVLGIVPTMVDIRLIHHREALQAMNAGGLPVTGVTIGRSVRVTEEAGNGKPIMVYDPVNPRTDEYKRVAEVIKRWLKSGRT